MCGRFVVAAAGRDLVEMFDVDLAADELPPPSFNVAPTDRVPVVLDTIPRGADPDDEPVRRLEGARWGLVPPWAKDAKVGATAFAARIESAAEDSHFANAVKRRRAVLPATGYYEWKATGETRTPHFIHPPDGELLVFAGLYEWWRDPAEADDSPRKWLLSASILTRASAGALAGIHDRMPVFLSPELLDEWLDPHTEGDDDLLAEISHGGGEMAERVRFHLVDPSVGDVRNNSPELMLQVGEERPPRLG